MWKINSCERACAPGIQVFFSFNVSKIYLQKVTKCVYKTNISFHKRGLIILSRFIWNLTLTDFFGSWVWLFGKLYEFLCVLTNKAVTLLNMCSVGAHLLYCGIRQPQPLITLCMWQQCAFPYASCGLYTLCMPYVNSLRHYNTCATAGIHKWSLTMAISC